MVEYYIYESMCNLYASYKLTSFCAFAFNSELTVAAWSVSPCSVDLVLGCSQDPSRKLFFLYVLITQRETIFVLTQKKLGSLLGMEFTNNCHPSMA